MGFRSYIYSFVFLLISVQCLSLQANRGAPRCTDNVRYSQFRLSDGYEVANSYLTMKYSWAITTKNDHDLRGYLTKEGYSNISIINTSQELSRLFVATRNGILTIIFDGTNGRNSTLENVLFSQTKSEVGELQGSIHKGFYRGFLTIVKNLKAVLNKFESRGLPVIVGGHSRGAVFATLTALWMVHHGYDVRHVYSMAQPHAGDELLKKQIAKDLDGKVFRVNMKRDITAFVPPAKGNAASFGAIVPGDEGSLEKLAEKLNYASHYGDVLILSKDGSYEFGREDDEKLRGDLFWKEVENTPRDPEDMSLKFLKPYFKEHDYKLYLCNLARLVNRLSY